MSQVLEELIRNWIRADGSVSDFILDLSEEECEDVKGYIPESLKTQFKVFCTHRRVTMRSVVYNLINEWIQVESDSRFCSQQKLLD